MLVCLRDRTVRVNGAEIPLNHPVPRRCTQQPQNNAPNKLNHPTINFLHYLQHHRPESSFHCRGESTAASALSRHTIAALFLTP